MQATYFDFVKPDDIRADHPVGQDFVDFARNTGRDELFAHQDRLFKRMLTRAWKTPFYQKLWGDKGMEPLDIRGLEDICKLPTFDKSDIMASLERNPPFGDFSALDSYPPERRPPVKFHTTSGTTGKPQVLIFGPKTREVQNLLLARLYELQGIGRGDVVHSVYGHGPINGGHYVREAVTHWTQAIFVSAGTGVETRSVKQVQMMADYRATVIVGFADYIKKLAKVAREAGLEPGRDIPVKIISGHMGREDRDSVSKMWGGAACFDWYGVGDTGAIAGEAADQDGMYVMEDAQYLEICDVDSGQPVQDGQVGDMVCTCLFKDDVYPIIRFNTHDVSTIRTGTSSLGFNLKRIEGFMGRSDNMVKLRGINLFPQAMGPILEKVEGFTGEFFCQVDRDENGRDDMTLVAETHNGDISGELEHVLQSALGIRLNVHCVQPGETATVTQVDVRQKPIRLVDRRF
ncbi:MAG: phenylacetate--CoA ligase family protein, partial [Hyphomonadaceae bacterium]|nr:phenylacetate--CoA ligase family protein [Hyphomonadaceae bacterium]